MAISSCGNTQKTVSATEEINNRLPVFDEMLCEPYEYYSELDALGRCGECIACVCKETMPTEKRGEIGMIKPSGWHTVKYPEVIKDNYLYNRCHLIGFQLTGENANEKNLITGTRYLNTEEMLPYENMIADYVKKTNHHVMYRVTPNFDKDNLVATSVTLEALSVEDDCICFNVTLPNIQPGVEIDYKTGESKLGGS